jgi:hypothetical protein
MKLFKILLILLLLCIGVFSLAFVYWHSLAGGKLQSQPTSATVPTITYLQKNKSPLPDFIMNISPAPGSVIKSDERICAILWPGGLMPAGAQYSADEINRTVTQTARYWINGYRVARTEEDIYDVAILDQLPDGRVTGRVNACITPHLNVGLHLIEIRTSPSFWGAFEIGEMTSYRWYYEVQ